MTVVRPTKFFRSSAGDLTPNNVGQLKVILEREMPQGFCSDLDAFCKEAVNTEDLSKLAYFNDMPVGAIVCSKQVDAKDQPTKTQKNAHPPHTFVIQALCVLEPYRQLGLVALLLQSIIEVANDKTKAIQCADLGKGDEAIEAVFSEAGFVETNGLWVKAMH
ncbi:hypothetical protein HDU98_000777 [Podochytrium sp. JEL0797]|nr:hypothetical protein HDU98_000777 [Podochytrium sp. JEL0797]